MAYNFEFTAQAKAEFDRLPPSVAKRILKKIDFFCTAPQPLQFAQPLIHHSLGDYRFRIGDYRVVVRVKDDIIYIVKVGHRRDIYR